MHLSMLSIHPQVRQGLDTGLEYVISYTQRHTILTRYWALVRHIAHFAMQMSYFIWMIARQSRR